MSTRTRAVGDSDDAMSALAAAESELLAGLRDGRCDKAAKAILEADYLWLGTGAGMSVGSGMGTYRAYSAQGDAPQSTGLCRPDGSAYTYEELASPEALRRDPAAFHAFMGSFFNAAQDATPSPGYRTLRAWQDFLFPGRAFTFTSNVDGIHARAGFEKVLECHGSKMCVACQLR